MFTKSLLHFDNNPFKDLSYQVEFEDITKGRMGTILVSTDDEMIPIIRTTTKYKNPVQKFNNSHFDLIKKIKESYQINDLDFNNGMIEIYDSSYYKMGFHTDQSLDLQDNSYICLFSCYDNPDNTKDYRKLKVINKLTNEQTEIILEHNSAVLFSTNNNKKHKHKIVLDPPNNSNTKWLGITLRLSKTFVKFINNLPYIYPNNKILKLANDDEQKEFYINKSKENKEINHTYPDINYTISPSDLLQIKD